MKSFFFLISGIILGLWISWPGIIFQKKWQCFFNIIKESKNEKLSLKAALAVSPKFLIKGESNDNASKLRIVSDACFR
tara:strand:- start:1747 stop:1980 length:234 start_codon:yes stop_codon:yes gene_type:complete